MRYLLALGSLAAAGLVVLSASAGPLDDVKEPASPEPPAKQGKPLTVVEAEKLVRDAIFRENPKMNPEAKFPLKDISKKAVWDRLGVQVFQVTEGVQVCETFIIRAKKVHRIGMGIGGNGVTSLAVADPNGDGRDKLIYAYSWGSGRHRSHVAVFDCLAKVPKQLVAPQAYFGDLGDLAVKNGKRDSVEIYAGKRKVGRLDLRGKEGALKAAILFDDDLPAEVKNGLKAME
jgi:hypothetical protein